MPDQRAMIAAGKTSGHGGTVLGWLFIGLLVAAGVAALVVGWPRMAAAWAARDWPITEGEVTHNEVASSVVPDSPDMYSPRIRYRYEVGGVEYVGSRVSFGRDSGYSRDAVEATVTRYPLGSGVRVYYDPADPSRSCLSPGAWYAGLSQTLTGAGLLTAAVVLAVVRLTRNRTQRTQRAPQP